MRKFPRSVIETLAMAALTPGDSTRSWSASAICRHPTGGSWLRSRLARLECVRDPEGLFARPRGKAAASPHPAVAAPRWAIRRRPWRSSLAAQLPHQLTSSLLAWLRALTRGRPGRPV